VIDLFRDVLVRLPNDSAHTGTHVLRTSARAIGSHVLGVARSGLLRAQRRLDYGNEEVVRRFLDATRTGAAPEAITASDGRAVVEVIEAAHNSPRV